MRKQRHAFHPTRNLNARSACTKRATPAPTPAPTPPATAADKPPSRPTVIKNLPPGLLLTPAQLTSLYDQLYDAGAFDPSDLTRKCSEWRDRDGRHVETFEGPCWTLDILLDPVPDHQTLPASVRSSCTAPFRVPNVLARAPTPTNQPPFTTLSLWCIATSDLNIDLSLYTIPHSTTTKSWTTWLRNIFPFMPFIPTSPHPSSPSSPSSPPPPPPPPPPAITYLFNSPGISRLPSQPLDPRHRLPPRPTLAPPWLPAGLSEPSESPRTGSTTAAGSGVPRPLRSAVRRGRRRVL